jgi:hypothetical protein
MIALADRIALPPGVTIDDGALVDEVRGIAVPLNATAQEALAGTSTVAGVAAILRDRGSLDPEGEAVTLCAELGERFLLNVAVPFRRRLVPLRYGLRPRTPPWRDTRVVRALVLSAGAVTLALLPLALPFGRAGIATAAATGAGVAAHELAHVLALGRTPRALVLAGARPSVLHAQLAGGRALLVAVAGPLVPALAGVALLAWAPVVSAPLAAHALALTVLAPDGRNACGLS